MTEVTGSASTLFYVPVRVLRRIRALGKGGIWNNCELRASAPGYLSSRYLLAGKVAGSAQINVGNLIIHRLDDRGTDRGKTISAADLAAPDKAKRDFGKGEAYLRKSDWKHAVQSFRKALDRDPSFSRAWAELARSQQESDVNGAQESFQKALAINPHLVQAYAGLSDIALRNRQWKDLEASTDRLLATNAEGFPQFWMLNAVAKYNLGEVDRAEASVLRGLRLDTQHRYPNPTMEHLFGVILGVKHQYAQAADHLKNYLRLDPRAPDATAVQTQLYRFEQLAAGK